MFLGTERRKYSRYHFKIDIEFVVKNETIFSTKSRNISTGGIFVISKEFFPVGTVGILNMEFHFDDEKVIITPQGEVVSVMSAIEPEKFFGMGVEFLRMDTQSEINLSNVIKSLGL